MKHAIDKHSKQIIAANIEVLLNHCVRFYDRQFLTREVTNHSILGRFEQLLTTYFTSDLPQNIGLPSVQHCAEKLHLSPNYFGDLINEPNVQKSSGSNSERVSDGKLADVE